MKIMDVIKRLQSELNEHGEGLEVDGILGPKTQGALDRFDLVDVSLAHVVMPLPKPAPRNPALNHKPLWVEFLESRIGWTEFDHDHEIAKDWPLVGLPQFDTVQGSKHAWCGLALAICMRQSGLNYPKGAAGAANWRGWGEACAYNCGAVLPIRHKAGGAHVTIFLYWIDEKKKLAACLGGNQNNAYRISTYNLSGNASGHDEVITGPRWPVGYPQTDFHYPRGNSDTGGSTR